MAVAQANKVVPPVPVASIVQDNAGKLSQEYVNFLRTLADWALTLKDFNDRIGALENAPPPVTTGYSKVELFSQNKTSIPATSATGFVTAGLGMYFTTRFAVQLLMTICGQIGNTAPAGVTEVMLIYGPGFPPSAGTSIYSTTGTWVGLSMSCQLASGFVPFSLTYPSFAVTPGMMYWVDLAIRSAAGGGSTSLSNINASVLGLTYP